MSTAITVTSGAWVEILPASSTAYVAVSGAKDIIFRYESTQPAATLWVGTNAKPRDTIQGLAASKCWARTAGQSEPTTVMQHGS